ncbi:MAG TPA: glycosyltransferase, partial [Acidimicrobiales bacterium]
MTRDAGDERLDAVLRGLAAQDHPNHRVLVVDAGGERDPGPHVRRLLPDARVLRLRGRPGFGAAANHVLDVARGARFLVFCHDDVVPEPRTISTLVDVAREWDAGIVGPKLVTWDDPSRLLQVGMAVDKVGTTMPFVERGELDQAQHDGLRQVFMVPGAFTLVRADLFESVGGFDEAITFFDDDLSLCWRAHVTGARVLVTSAARVRHAEALSATISTRDRQCLVARHRLRALLTCTGPARLLLVLPQALALTAGEALGALATGRAGRARDALGAWVWNVRRLRSLLVARRHMKAVRRVPDRTIRRYQVHGIVAPRLQLRRLGGDARAAATRPVVTGPVPDDPARWTPGTALACVAVAAVLAFGSRHLITRFVPAVGEMVPFGADPGRLLSEWASGWRHAGLGSDTAAPTLAGVVGALGSLLRDQVGALRMLLTLGML